eukprot:4294095-Alexandrium_andersonii.AAC.1
MENCAEASSRKSTSNFLLWSSAGSSGLARYSCSPPPRIKQSTWSMARRCSRAAVLVPPTS